MDEHEKSSGNDQQPCKVVWEFWPTVGFSVVVITVIFAVQVGITIAFLAFQMAAYPQTSFDAHLESIVKNADLAWVSSILSNICIVLLVALFIWFKKGATISTYLDLNTPAVASAFAWAGVCLAYCIAADLLFMVLKIDTSNAWLEMYRNTRFLPLLILAANIAAPVAEEIFFRGFMFEGIRATRGGAVTAVVSSSFLWSIIHVQYTIPLMAVIFFGGLMLGIARVRTRSVYIVILMHFVWNLYATVTVVIAS